MRYLVTVLILALVTGLAQARQAGEARPAARPKDPPASSITTTDRVTMPRGVRDKARTKSVETMIPDICRGC